MLQRMDLGRQTAKYREYIKPPPGQPWQPGPWMVVSGNVLVTIDPAKFLKLKEVRAALLSKKHRATLAHGAIVFQAVEVEGPKPE